jgi:hypothetical protein
LHIAVTNPATNETLALQRNGATVMTFAAVADTNIADTALTQTTAYQYTARLTANNEATGTSNTLSAQTLAPTSHNFTWQTFLLGDGNNSSLYDVAILNDTLIYAVGELYLRDSSGAIGDTPYNLAKWNGVSWALKRIPFIGSCSAVDYPPLKAIWAFSPTEILVTNGGSIVRYDGTNSVMDCRMNSLLTGAINRIYGFNTNDVYVVGGAGSIVHYNGTTWRRLESGTTTRINDAWGVVNPVTGKEEVYCPVTDFFVPGDKRILRITEGARVDSIAWQPRRNIYSVWSHNGFPLYVCGSTLHRQRGGAWEEVSYGGNYAVNLIRGNAANDIIVAGDFGVIGHYNGLDWQMIGLDFNTVYGSIAMNHRSVVIAGFRNARGIVMIGRRN